MAGSTREQRRAGNQAARTDVPSRIDIAATTDKTSPGFTPSASAPMFVPGLGAFVLLKQKWVNAGEDARIGLAGPFWGLAAAIASWILWLITKQPVWTGIGAGGAWINLLNLIPVSNLDGGRFLSLERSRLRLDELKNGVPGTFDFIKLQC